MRKHLLIAALMLLAISGKATAEGSHWKHSGSLYIITTPEGADLPSTFSEKGFPLLVRLDKEFFNFTQAKANGEDIRFTTADGRPLAYQIEQWDKTGRAASIWVRIPAIKGNSRQEIRMHWGNADASSESSGSAVFNQSNGYVSVWHMDDPTEDEVGTLATTDAGTTPTAGMIGEARHFPGKQGLFGGDKIPDYPSAGSSHSSEAWFRTARTNTTILGWGNEGGGRGSKVRMQFRAPPHVHIDSDFSDVNGESTLPMSQWTHVMHTYDNGDGRIYINGRLDGSDTPTLDIKSPARLWIGGWYHHYDFIGDIDEVRISRVARCPDWIKLQFENQKPLQTLVGPLVQPGDTFSVAPTQLIVSEGKRVAVTARAGGAQKVYWILKDDNRETPDQETIIAVDRYAFTFDAGRVTSGQSLTLRFKAIYADAVKTKDIPITINESIPDPAFTLTAPNKWDGREAIEVLPRIANLDQLRAHGASELNYHWNVSGLAVIKQIEPGKLILERAQNSGRMTVTLALDNGGAATTHTATILVDEPAEDAWVQRMPEKDEKPADNQFYARDDKQFGTLYYNGTLAEAGDSVYLKVYADDKLYAEEERDLATDRTYAFSVKLKAGLVKYRVEFGSKTENLATLLDTATNLVCGDAYIIQGQSNAEATQFGEDKKPYTSEWIRTYGRPRTDPEGARLKGWHIAVRRVDGGKAQVGYWGLDLARRLVESRRIPICIINGAVGGTRIDQHQRNPADPEDVATIYGRLLWRVRQAKLTHGIRGVLWHQGENDQAANGPTGRFAWETYQQDFIDMSAAWKEDFPNIQSYYIFQIWPAACGTVIKGSDNRLREKQRTLPYLYSNMGIMSTLGIRPGSSCHYSAAGYAEFSRLIFPLVERDNYGKVFKKSITPADLEKAYYTSDRKDEIALEFDQDMSWEDKDADHTLADQFYLDGNPGKVTSGTVSGRVIALKLAEASSARQITYLDGVSWNMKRPFLEGSNGIAALTFCEVPIVEAKRQRAQCLVPPRSDLGKNR